MMADSKERNTGAMSGQDYSMIILIQLMNQNHLSNSGYRIKRQRNNFMSNEDEAEADPFKISIHSSAQKSPEKKPKRNGSLANRQTNQDKQSERTKKSNLKMNLSSSSFSSGKKPKPEGEKVKEFNNVKQLLMIKAYDKKLLRKVTATNEANKNFLKLGDVKSDFFRKETFKVMVQNFKEMAIRIRKGYQRVLSKILSQNTNQSAIVTLASVQPTLESLRQEADEMHFKVKECEDTHHSRQFTSLMRRFENFLVATKEIEEIILIVHESKNRIDGLFKDLEKDRHFDERINNERKKGLKKVREAVKEYGNTGVQVQILSKVEAAINEMADKNLQAYSQITGIRGLFNRIRSYLKEKKEQYELEDIVKLNRIFKQVLHEAQCFSKFSQRFLSEQDLLNDDLRKCIQKYRNEVEVNKRSIHSIQAKFLCNIIQTSIQGFQGCYSVCNAVQSTAPEEYPKIEGLLIDIAQVIEEQTMKVTIESMCRDVNSKHRALTKHIKGLRQCDKVVYLDSPEGMQVLKGLKSLVEAHKKNIGEVVDRQARAYRQISKRRPRTQNLEGVDPEQACLTKMIEISQNLNNQALKQQIRRCVMISPIQPSSSISELAQHIDAGDLLRRIKHHSEIIDQIASKNELSTIVSRLDTQQKIYSVAGVFLGAFQIAVATTEQNLLQRMTMLTAEHNKKSVQALQIFTPYFQRLFCLALKKGLDQKTLAKVQDNQLIQFPQNQHDVQTLKRDEKYLKTISKLMPDTLARRRVEETAKTAADLLEGVRISQELKFNHQGRYYLKSTHIFEYVRQIFHVSFLAKQKEIFGLEKILEEVKTIGKNLSKLREIQQNSNLNAIRVRKITQIIKEYENKNQKLLQKLVDITIGDNTETYSRLVFLFAEYLQSTCQSFHATLNKSGRILWITQYTKDKPKNSEFAKLLGLGSLKCGEIAKKYNQKQPVQVCKKAPPPAPAKKVKPRPAVDVDQQIIEDSLKQASEIGDEIYSQECPEVMEEDMAEQMDEEMVEQIGDQMAEQLDEQPIPEDYIEDDLNIESDLDDEHGKKHNKKVQEEFDFSDEDKPKNKRTDPKKDKVKPNSQKPQQPKKEQKNEEIVIKQKQFKKLFEEFKYIQRLQELQVIIKKIEWLTQDYWKTVDVGVIENYYNQQSKVEVDRVLLQKLEMFIRQSFVQDFVASIQQLGSYKSIIKSIESIGLLNLAQLLRILQTLKKQHSYLVGTNKQLLRLSVKRGDRWKPETCVEAYVTNQLKQVSLRPDNFAIQEYIRSLIRQTGKLESRFQFSSTKLRIDPAELKGVLNKIGKLAKEYESFGHFPDGVNLQELITKMWSNCISKQREPIQITRKLEEALSELQQYADSSSYIFYVTDLRKQVDKTATKLRQHLQSMANILQSLNKQNLLESISTILKVYEAKNQKIVNYENIPVMYIDDRQANTTTEASKAVNFLLLPSKLQSRSVTSQSLHGAIRSQPELYVDHAEYFQQILSILEVQSHLWASALVLHITESRDEVIRHIISEVSGGVIANAQEELSTLGFVNQALKVVNRWPLVYEYAVADKAEVMNTQKNIKYYQEYVAAVAEYDKLSRSTLNVGEAVFESLFGLEDSEDSATSRIMEQIEGLSMLGEGDIFVGETKTIFRYHTVIGSRIKQMKSSIQENAQLLGQIIQQPIKVHDRDADKTLQEVQGKNKKIIEWLDKFRGRKEASLNRIQISLSGDGHTNHLLCIGEEKVDLSRFIGKLVSSKESRETLSQLIDGHSKNEGPRAVVVHIGEVLGQVCSSLSKENKQLYFRFIDSYNALYFKMDNPKGKESAFRQAYDQLDKDTQGRVALLGCLGQLTAKSATVSKVLIHQITQACKESLHDMSSEVESEQQKLADVGSKAMNYRVFGSWVAEVVGKIKNYQFAILLDKVDGDMLCMLPADSDDRIRASLRMLSLPEQYVVKDQQAHHKKIELKDQTISINFDVRVLSKQQLHSVVQENLIIKEEKVGKHFLGLAVFLDDEVKPWATHAITSEVLERPIRLEIGFTKQETFRNIEIRLVQLIKSEKDGDVIVRELTVEQHPKVYINKEIQISAISKYLKKQGTRMSEFRIEEKRKATQKTQREERERREREQKEERERRRQKESEQRAQKKKLQQLSRQAEEEQQKQKQRLQFEQQEKRIAQQQQNLTHKFILGDDYSEGPGQSTRKLNHKVQVYLDRLYKQLAESQARIISYQDLSRPSKKNIRESSILSSLKSIKNISLRQITQKSLKKIEAQVDESQKLQFNQFAEEYMDHLNQLICEREALLSEVISKVARPDFAPAKQEESPSFIAPLLEEIRRMPSYSQGLRDRYIQVVNSLPASKQQLLGGIYNK